MLLLNWASSLLLPHCSFYWSYAKLSFWLKLPNLSHFFRNLNNQKYAFPFNFFARTIVISDALLTVWCGTLITLHSTLFRNMHSDSISYHNFIVWKLLSSYAFMLPFKALLIRSTFVNIWASYGKVKMWRWMSNQGVFVPGCSNTACPCSQHFPQSQNESLVYSALGTMSRLV